MEGFTDLCQKKTTSYPLQSPNQQSVVRLENASIDRSGVAARFLRLAFRINMEQHKLVQLDQPPPAEPLSAEEQAEEDRQLAADAQEFAEARRRSAERADEALRPERERRERMQAGSQESSGKGSGVDCDSDPPLGKTTPQ